MMDILKAVNDKIAEIAGRPNVVHRGVYLASVTHGGEEYIKVGWSIEVNTRLSKLNGGCPFPIDLVGTVDAIRDDEYKMHRMLSAYHHKLEWFKIEREVLFELLEANGWKVRRYP